VFHTTTSRRRNSMNRKPDTAIPERSEMPEEYTWDLSSLFSSEEAWEEGLRTMSERTESFEPYRGTLGQSADRLADCLDLLFDTERLGERLGYYAHLRTAENVGDSSRQNRFSRYMQAATRLSAATSFIIPEIQSIPDETIEAFLESPRIEQYEIRLRQILRFKPYILSPREEKLLAMQAQAKQTPERAFSALTNVDLDFGTIETPEGERPLSQSSFGSLMQHRERDVRERTYRTFYSRFEQHQNTLAALYDGSVQQDIYEASVRGYSSAREMALFPDAVPEEVYDNLISVVHEHLPLLHRYYELRRRVLGLEALAHWDVYVPLVPEVESNTPYEEAVETITTALAPLGEEYCSTLKAGLLGGWVDRYENKGKRSGAFSAGSYDSDPFILMNYKEDVLRDVFTLAHEGGHSMHSWYSARNNPFPHYSYTIFEAEVASTFNEQLLADYLLKNSEDERMKSYLYGKLADDFIATLFRQTMFAEFEHTAHRMVETGTPLTVDSLRSSYAELLRTFFGEKTELPEMSSMEALRIPHFYRAYYVYKYATGLAASIALSQRVLHGGEHERQHYLDFLKSGGSTYPIQSLRTAGVNMESPEPIREAMYHFESLVNELEERLG
jgi:oligoendopeptidase F